MKGNSLSGISTAILAVIVIILLVVVGAGVYYYTASTVTPSTSVSTVATTAVSTVTAPTTMAPVSITVWADYAPGSTEYQAFNETVAGFESAYPYIHLNLETHSSSTQEADFEVAALANQGPDVIRGPSDWVGTLVGEGSITSLTPYVNSTFMSQYFPAAIQDFSYQGHLWGLPENINGLGLVYNKALLPNGPPTTTTQLLSECPSLTKTSASGAITQACIVFPLDSGYWWWPFLTGFGGAIFNATNPNQPLLNSSAALNSIAFRNSLINDGFMPYNTCCNTMTSMFGSGNAAMIIDGPWDEGTWVHDNISYGIAPLPTVSSTNLPMAPIIGAQGWYVASGKPPAETAAAFKFVTWFTNSQHQSDEFTLAGDLPSNSALASTSTITGNPAAAGYLAQAAKSGPTPNFPAMGEAYTATGDYLTTIAPSTETTIITNSSIQTGLNSMEATIYKALGSLA